MPDGAASVRPPQQKRSQASFARVLHAGIRLLEQKGYQGFTLQEVSRRAGVSIGSIYARVPSKDALFHAIHIEAMREIDGDDPLGAVDELAHLPTRELVVEAVRRLAQPFRAHAAILGVFMHRGAVDDVVAMRGSAASSERGERFSALLLTRRDDIRHPEPELAVDVAYRMAYCTLARQVMYGPTFESQREIDWDELVAELGRACASYLLGSL
jgi:AcrR family transcriptional regulator